MTITRRQWLRLSSTATLGTLAGLSAGVIGCGEQSLAPLEDAEEGHLLARPVTPVFSPQIGVNPLGLNNGRDGLRFVPTTFQPGESLPLLVTLHGSGGDAYGGIQPFLPFAESARVILISPDSRNVTWDRRYGGFAVDARFIDNALSETFLRCAIDPAKIAIAGFSDGASYALSLGLTNGDLFKQIVAFSPGFMIPNVQRGRPEIFVSHGTRDPILPIDTSSRVFVPRLQAANYDVTYREFDGTHQMPPAVTSEAFAWLQTEWAKATVV